jgi:hypothetical protein
MSTDLTDNQLTWEILVKHNKLVVSHIFKHDIDIVYKIFIRPSCYREIYGSLMHELHCINGKSMLNSLGSEFSFLWGTNINAKFRVSEVIETVTYKSLLFDYYSVEPSEFKYGLVYKFIKNTSEPLTYFTYSLIFKSPQALSFHQINFSSQEKLDILNNMSKILVKYTQCTEQVESILIDCDLTGLWQILQDWKKFHKLAPSMADCVEYDSNIDDVRIKLRFDNCKIEHILKLIRSHKDDCSGELVLCLYSSNMKSLAQEVLFNIHRINERQSLLIFKHIFKRIIDQTHLLELSNSKKQILEQLRDNLKNYLTDSTSEGNSTVDETVD